jgi:hypothetical protein
LDEPRFTDVAGSGGNQHSFADPRNVIRRPAASASPWTPLTVIDGGYNSS